MHNVGIDPGIQIMQQSIHERVPMFTHEGLVHQAVTSITESGTEYLYLADCEPNGTEI
jgi:hypothetical protein